MTHEELADAVPLYAAGALDRTERQALEAHLLSGCASCHGALRDYQAVAASLPLGLSQTRPPRSLKASLMETRNFTSISNEDIPSEPTRSSLEPGEWMNHLFPPIAPARSFSLPWVLGLAALLIVGVGGYFIWDFTAQHADDVSKMQELETSLQEQSTKFSTLQRELDSQTQALADLHNEIQQRRNETAEAQEQLAQREAELAETRMQLSRRGGARTAKTPQDELAALLRRPNIQVTTLTGSDMAKRAAGFLLYDPLLRKIWLYSVNLPECPAGTTYQLWAIAGKPVSIGTFQMPPGATAHLLVKNVSNFTSAKTFSVSLEPSGGRPQPTGSMYLLSRS